MKKLSLVFLMVILILGLAACGEKSEGAPAVSTAPTDASNPILVYMEKGYVSNGVSITDGTMSILFASPDRTEFVQVEVPLTEEEDAAYNALDFFAADYDQQEKDFFATLSGEFSVTDLSAEIPPQEELDQLVGKTLGELEAMGYEQTSVDMGEDDLVVLIYSDETVDLMIYPEGEFEDLFSLAEEDLAALTVAKVQFYGFGA